MRTSTLSRWLFPLLVLVWAMPAFAQRPVIAVAPAGHDVPNIRRGIAAQLWRELLDSGRYQLADNGVVADVLAQLEYEPTIAQPTDEQLSGVSEIADYLLVPRLLAFDVVDREAVSELNSDLRDLGSLLVGQDKEAYVALDVSLYETESAKEVARFTVEGIESKQGVRIKNVTQGWLGSVDVDSDEFRRTNIGIATYKAIGELMRRLYVKFPMRGSVLAVSGDSIVLDLDEDSGLLLGDELAIVRSRRITNLAGEAVWVDEQRVGSCRVIEFQPGRCLCQILDGFNAIQEGDEVVPLVESLVLPQETDSTE